MSIHTPAIAAALRQLANGLSEPGFGRDADLRRAILDHAGAMLALQDVPKRPLSEEPPEDELVVIERAMASRRRLERCAGDWLDTVVSLAVGVADEDAVTQPAEPSRSAARGA